MLRSLHLGVNADDLATLVAVVGEHVLVALDAVGVVVPQHVPTSKVNFLKEKSTPLPVYTVTKAHGV